MKRNGLFFLILSSFQVSFSQGFGAEFLLGANFSQVDGDQLAGYNKLGLNLGIQINREIKTDWQAAFEIRYSMKGAKKVIDPEAPPSFDLKLSYHYVEVPLLVKYNGLENITLYAGPSVGVNVVNKRNENGRISEEDELNPMEFGMHLGATYYVSDHLGLDVRHSYSMLSISNMPFIVNSPTWFGRAGWYNRLFTIGITYKP